MIKLFEHFKVFKTLVLVVTLGVLSLCFSHHSNAQEQKSWVFLQSDSAFFVGVNDSLMCASPQTAYQFPISVNKGNSVWLFSGDAQQQLSFQFFAEEANRKQSYHINISNKIYVLPEFEEPILQREIDSLKNTCIVDTTTATTLKELFAKTMGKGNSGGCYPPTPHSTFENKLEEFQDEFIASQKLKSISKWLDQEEACLTKLQWEQLFAEFEFDDQKLTLSQQMINRVFNPTSILNLESGILLENNKRKFKEILNQQIENQD